MPWVRGLSLTKVARKVYAVEPLHSEAADLWACMPLEERSGARLRAAQGDSEATCDEPLRSAADRDADLLAKLGDDDLIDCALRTGLLRRRAATA